MSTQHPRSAHRSATVLVLAITLAALVGVGGAQVDRPTGLVETPFPSEADPGMPFYARIEPLDGHLFEDGAYAVVAFYRGPAGIRDDFDLLALFDVPAAFGVESNVAGTNVWHEAAGTGAPYESRSHATRSVPIWFVPLAPLLEVMATGRLTMADLAAVPGILVGQADAFEELLRPHALPAEMGGGGHPEPELRIDASGVLEDGRRFEVTLTGVEGPDGWRRTTTRRFE